MLKRVHVYLVLVGACNVDGLAAVPANLLGSRDQGVPGACLATLRWAAVWRIMLILGREYG